MNCYYHPDEVSQIQCKQCEKHICNKCHDSEYEGYCYSCSLDFRNGAKEYNSFSEQKTRKYRMTNKIIGWYEIIGGSFGVLLVFIFSIRLANSMQLFSIMIFFLFAVLFLFSIISGILLLRNHTRGELLSIIVQALQIPQFIIKGIAYSFVAGGKFTLQYFNGLGTGFKIDFGIFSEFNFYINSNVHGYLIGLNLVPIILIFILQKNKINKESLIGETTEVSQ